MDSGLVVIHSQREFATMEDFLAAIEAGEDLVIEE